VAVVYPLGRPPHAVRAVRAWLSYVIEKRWETSIKEGEDQESVSARKSGNVNVYRNGAPDLHILLQRDNVTEL
jgi:hypothetical protein